MAETSRMAEIRKDYPHTSGLGASDKHEGRQTNLIPEDGSSVRKIMKTGMMD